MRAIALLILLAAAGCAPYDGPPVVAPSGISANHRFGDDRGGGAEPIFSGRGSSTTISRGSR